MERAKIKFSEKKIFRSQETHKVSKAYLCQKKFQIYKRMSFCQEISLFCVIHGSNKNFFSISKPNNPKIVPKYRAAWNFLQIYFVTLSHDTNRIIIISIMKFYTSASLVLTVMLKRRPCRLCRLRVIFLLVP